MENKKRYRKQILIFFLVSVISLLFSGCKVSKDQPIVFKEYHSGDSKFLSEDKLVASKDGKLHVLDLKTKGDTEIEIDSNWIDCLLDEKIIVYSNSKNQTGICKLDEENNIIFNQIIFEDNTLHIDPSIMKVEDTYYLTSTRIIGNVNNSDENMENGIYTIQLFKSQDLAHWEYVSDIISKQSNLEDVELMNDEGTLRLIFEKEILDKKESSISMIESRDHGLTWENEKEILENGGDNEPASFYREQNAYYLYYSSDIENPGKSYEGSAGYLTTLDESFNVIETKRMETKNKENLLLYQVIKKKDGIVLLYAYDYLGKNDLWIEAINSGN